MSNFGYGLAGLSQGLAQGLSLGAQYGQRERESKREEAYRNAQLKMKQREDRLTLTKSLIDDVGKGEPKELVQMKLNLLGRGFGLDDDSFLGESLNSLLTSRDERARERGTQLLSAMTFLDDEQITQLEKGLKDDPIHFANVIDKGISELFKRPTAEQSGVVTSTFPSPGGRQMLAGTITRGPKAGQPAFETRDLGPVRQPPEPPSFTAYVDPKSGQTIITQGKGEDIGRALSAGEIAAFRKQQAGFVNARNLRNRFAEDFSNSKNPDALVGLIGTGSRFIDTFLAQAKAAARTLGVDLGDEKELLDVGNYDFSKFQSNAAKSAAVQSRLISLAYAMAAAKGQTGQSISNRDIQNFLDIIGARSGSTQQMMSAIDESLIGLHDSLKATAEGLGVPVPNLLGNLAPSEAPEDQSIDLPAQLRNEPDGTTVPDKSGKLWVKRGNKLYLQGQ